MSILLQNYVYKKALELIKKYAKRRPPLPCEGYPVWSIARYLMSGMSFKIRNSKNFKEVQKREHIDNYDEILAIPKRRI
jgi:hypothetical protein